MIKCKFTLKRNNLKQTEITRRLSELTKKSLKVGVFPEDGASNVTTATRNHLGLGGVIQRPFIAQPMEKNQGEIFENMKSVVENTIEQTSTIGSSSTTLEDVGELIVEKINSSIEQKEYTPNPEHVRKEKGSDTPLVIDGTLKNSIKSKIVND